MTLCKVEITQFTPTVVRAGESYTAEIKIELPQAPSHVGTINVALAMKLLDLPTQVIVGREITLKPGEKTYTVKITAQMPTPSEMMTELSEGEYTATVFAVAYGWYDTFNYTMGMSREMFIKYIVGEKKPIPYPTAAEAYIENTGRNTLSTGQTTTFKVTITLDKELPEDGEADIYIEALRGHVMWTLTRSTVKMRRGTKTLTVDIPYTAEEAWWIPPGTGETFYISTMGKIRFGTHAVSFLGGVLELRYEREQGRYVPLNVKIDISCPRSMTPSTLQIALDRENFTGLGTAQALMLPGTHTISILGYVKEGRHTLYIRGTNMECCRAEIYVDGEKKGETDCIDKTHTYTLNIYVKQKPTQRPTRARCRIEAPQTVKPLERATAEITVELDKPTPVDTPVTATLYYTYGGEQVEIGRKTVILTKLDKTAKLYIDWIVPELGLQPGQETTLTLVADVEVTKLGLETQCTTQTRYIETTEKPQHTQCTVKIEVTREEKPVTTVHPGDTVTVKATSRINRNTDEKVRFTLHLPGRDITHTVQAHSGEAETEFRLEIPYLGPRPRTIPITVEAYWTQSACDAWNTTYVLYSRTMTRLRLEIEQE